MTPPTSSRWRAVQFDRDSTLACTDQEVYREAALWLYKQFGLELPAGAVLFVDDLPENVQAAQVLGLGAVQIDLSSGVPGAVHCLWDVLTLVDEPVAG